MARKLTPKQAKFKEIYLSNGRNAAAAYRGAYKTTMNPQRCHQEGNKLLRHPLIRPTIERAERRAEQAIAGLYSGLLPGVQLASLAAYSGTRSAESRCIE